MLTTGLRIKKLREIRGYSQDFMALKLKISQEQYSYLENRQKNIPLRYIEIIASLLEISVEDLKSFDPEMAVNNGSKSHESRYIDIHTIVLRSHENEIEAYKELIRKLKEELTELRQRIK